MRITKRCLNKLILAVVLGLAGTLLFANDERNISFAIEKAAQQAVSQMAKSPKVKGIETIAFIGFGGDKKGYSSIFRAALHNIPGNFKFYVRKDVEWGLLTKEIELGMKRGDIMDAKTLQKFGNFKGVSAYLYGAIREAGIDPDGAAVFRITLTLAKIETGEHLWEGNVIGRYAGKIIREEVPATLIKAAKNAGMVIKEKLLVEKGKIPYCNVFVLPILGQKANAVSDVIVSQLVITGDSRLSLYSNPASVSPLAVKDIAQDLEQNSASYNSQQMNHIMNKLEKMYNIPSGASGGSKYGGKTNTYMIARVMNANANDKEGSLILDVKIRDFANNKIVWSGTFEGQFKEKEPEIEQTSNQKVKSFWNNNSTLIIILGIVIVVVFVVPTFFFLNSRVR